MRVYAAAWNRSLTRAGSHIIRSASSESMFDRFVALVSRALARTTRNRWVLHPNWSD